MLFGGQRSVAVRLDLNARGYLTGLATAGKATQDWARAADQSIQKHRRSWTEIGDAAGKAGLVIGAGAAVAVVKFAQFDKSMSRAAAGTQATAAQMGQLRQAAIDAGQATQFSATEAADAITEMGKAGVSVRDILGGGLTGTLALAAAGELEVADAAEIAATALTQFGLKGSDLPHVADLLAAGAGKAQGSVQDLGMALKYVGPVAKSANIPIEETVGAIAELASQGIIGEQAGTSLRGMLQSLRGPSEKAKTTMKELGVELYGADGRFIGLAGAAEQLRTKLGPLPEAQRDAALATLFGNEQVTAATILMNGGAAAVDKWTAAVNDQGYAARQAGQLMNNLAGDWEQFTGSLETALISSGSGANSGLRDLVQGATKAVNAFSSLPAPVQRGTVVVAGLTAGALLLTAGVVKGAIAIRTMRANLAELGVTGTATKGVLAGVGRAAATVATAALVAEGGHALAKSFGVVGDGTERMQLELANYAKGAALAGDAAKLFGANLEGQRSATNLISQDLKTVVNDLSGVNGWWRKDLPVVGSDEADQIRELGRALAGLAQGGHADTAAAAFGRLAKSAGLNEEETKRLLKLMPEYDGYLSQVAATQVANGEAAAGAADSMTVLQSAMGDASGSAKQLASDLADARKATKDLNDAFLGSRSAARQYQQALDDAADIGKKRGEAAKKVAEAEKDLRTAKTASQRKTAAEALARAREEAASYGKSLDITTEAGRRNQAALDDIAKAAQDQADGIIATGGTQAQYRASLEASRADLKRVAIQFGMTEKQAQAYIDTVLAVPSEANTKVGLDGVEDATAKLQTLLDKVATINGKAAVVQIDAQAANVRENRGGETNAPAPAPAPARPGRAAPNGALLRKIEGMRASGGPVLAGKDYLVGEKRAEIFRPGSNGYVFPSVAAAHAAPMAAPTVVRVPVRESSSTDRSVHLHGPVTVRAATPSQFTDWASTQSRFGTGGVG